VDVDVCIPISDAELCDFNCLRAGVGGTGRSQLSVDFGATDGSDSTNKSDWCGRIAMCFDGGLLDFRAGDFTVEVVEMRVFFKLVTRNETVNESGCSGRSDCRTHRGRQG
jgi:hypothetical protein